MDYTIGKLAKVTGLSTRTLRHYDSIGLLKPRALSPAGYRVYGRAEVDRLHQILLFREQGFPLEEIKALLDAPGFDRALAYERHLAALHETRARLDALIANVERAAAAMKGECAMSDQEKFEVFKQKLVEDNERRYGEEVRARYGDRAVDDSNAKLQGITQEQYDESIRLNLAFEETLKAAFDTGDPAGPLAQKACDLHRQWLAIFTPHYSREYHRGLGELYVSDPRFRANYDKLAPGCTEFLRDAIARYCETAPE